jgi:hypothetical protein
MIWVALASRAVLYVDSRVDFTPHIAAIETQIRRRIFDKGWNALDQQMARAKDRPTGRYRYRTGRLYESLRVLHPRAGELVMVFDYQDVVLAFLNRKYGPIFDWSPSDIAFVSTIAAVAGPSARTPAIPVFAPPPSITPPPTNAVTRSGVVAGFESSYSSRARAVEVEGGVYVVDGRVFSVVQPLRFDVPPRAQFERYDAVVATPYGVQYRTGGSRPYRKGLREIVLLFIFVPPEDSSERETITKANGS